ncbi:hypothetical protein RvY_06865-2 [Ramazzottius varieornatus]|uniref:BED-type domain-containing protein n=1 Tax=Ramazzottius varieornatus TaxID=947166 RepID=A0A1D1V039_RAMVA|nr:hypothetical protein RvY_06865-2 [Ramazzottius varieornatus]
MRPPSRTKPIKGAKKKLPPERGKVPVAAAIAASPPVIDIAETDDGSDSEDESSRPPSTSSFSRFSQKRKLPGGQKKASAVWQYYTEDAETGTSTCKSCNHEAKPAGNTGNAVSHLKNRHPDAFAKYEEQEKLRKDLKKKEQDKPATGIAMIQSKLKFESSNPYEQGSLRIKRHRCTIHRLQTAVRAFEKDEKLKPITKKARIIVKTFRMSHVATGELLKATGLTLYVKQICQPDGILLCSFCDDLMKYENP